MTVRRPRPQNAASRGRRGARGGTVTRSASELPLDVVCRLFEAKSVRQFVATAYELVRDIVPCDFVSVLYRSAGTAMLKERDSRGRTYSAAFMRRYGELTPAAKLAMAHPGIKMLPTRIGLPSNDSELQRMAFYREVMLPQGWRHAVALCFWQSPLSDFPILVVTVNRQPGRTDFDDHEASRLEALYSLLQAAVTRLLERSATQSILGGLAAALGNLSKGLIVLDASRRVIMANAAARQLCADATRRLAADSRANTSAWLPAALQDACDGLETAWRTRRRPARPSPWAQGETRLLSASRDVVARVRIEDRLWLGPLEPIFFVELATISDSSEPSLLRDGKFTKAEREVVQALVEGLSNQEIAERLKKSVYAVKFLLHRVYRRTGLGNRTRVVAQVAALTTAAGWTQRPTGASDGKARS